MSGNMLLVIVITALLGSALAGRDAMVNTSYYDASEERVISNIHQIGTYGQDSSTQPEWGWLVHAKTEDGENHGCSVPANMHHERWIALIQRGSCKFQEKIDNAVITGNASAVVVYNNQVDGKLQMMHENDEVVAIFIGKEDGTNLAGLVDGGTKVWMRITDPSQTHIEGGYVQLADLAPTTTPAPTTTTTTTAPTSMTKPTQRYISKKKNDKNQILKDGPKVAKLGADPAVTTDIPPTPESHACHVTVSTAMFFIASTLSILLNLWIS